MIAAGVWEVTGQEARSRVKAGVTGSWWGPCSLSQTQAGGADVDPRPNPSGPSPCGHSSSMCRAGNRTGRSAAGRGLKWRATRGGRLWARTATCSAGSCWVAEPWTPGGDRPAAWSLGFPPDCVPPTRLHLGANRLPDAAKFSRPSADACCRLGTKAFPRDGRFPAVEDWADIGRRCKVARAARH